MYVSLKKKNLYVSIYWLVRFSRKTEAICGLLSMVDGSRTDIMHSEGTELAYTGCLSVFLLHSFLFVFGPVCGAVMPTDRDGFTSSVVLLHPSALSVNTLVDITRSLPDWFPKHHSTFNNNNKKST